MGQHEIDLFALTAPARAGDGSREDVQYDPQQNLRQDPARGPGQNPGQRPGRGRVVSGRRDLAGFARLTEGLPAQADTQVEWSVRGEGTVAGKRFIDVRAQARVTLECQRCLKPFVLPLRVENRLEVVRSPSELEDDEEIERIVGSTRFDVLELIEDELILCLPAIPKHDVCPSVPGGSGPSDEPDAEAARPSPFAALEKLKKDRI